MKNIYFALLLGMFSGCVSETGSPMDIDEIKEHETLFISLSEEDAQFLANESLSYLDTEYPYHVGVLGTAEDLKLPRDARPVFFGAGGWASAVQTVTGLVRLVKIHPSLDSIYQVSDKLLQRITDEGISGEVAYLNNPFTRNSGRGSGWNNVLKLATELQSWDHTAAPILLSSLQPLLTLIEERTANGLKGQVYPYRGSTANGLAVLWDYAHAFENDTLKVLVEEKARVFFQSNTNYKLSEESNKSSSLSAGLEEIHLMRLILPPVEYKEWLHAYSDELYSPEFVMEPAIRLINDEEDEMEKTNVMKNLDQADMLNINRAKRLSELAESDPDLLHLNELAYKHLIQALWDAGSDADLKIRVFHAQL